MHTCVCMDSSYVQLQVHVTIVNNQHQNNNFKCFANFWNKNALAIAVYIGSEKSSVNLTIFIVVKNEVKWNQEYYYVLLVKCIAIAVIIAL